VPQYNLRCHYSHQQCLVCHNSPSPFIYHMSVHNFSSLGLIQMKQVMVVNHNLREMDCEPKHGRWGGVSSRAVRSQRRWPLPHLAPPTTSPGQASIWWHHAPPPVSLGLQLVIINVSSWSTFVGGSQWPLRLPPHICRSTPWARVVGRSQPPHRVALRGMHVQRMHYQPNKLPSFRTSTCSSRVDMWLIFWSTMINFHNHSDWKLVGL
jgi:hypothetical protein